jgi:hypothetical protein
MDSADMLTGFSYEDTLTLFSVTGGVPEYLSRVDKSLSVQENVRDLFFNPSGRLFEEPTNLLKQELKMPETYNAIIAAIAGGSSKLNEIATKVGIETSQTSKMLSTLISLGIVRKEIPVTEAKSKKSIYILNDWMFVFWYRFVLPEISRITAGVGEEVCDEVFSGYLSSHIGRVFEECVIQYMWRALKKKILPFNFKKIGRWWGNNPVQRREEEIDFIAYNGENALFGECKWINIPIGEGILNEIICKAQLFSNFTNKHYMLFSKSGFSDDLRKMAVSQGGIALIGIEDLFTIESR